MSDQFVPLFPAIEEAGAPLDCNRLMAAPASETEGTQARFQAVDAVPALARSLSPSEGCTSPGQPTITYQREGDRITRISVQCGCGATIDLQCEY
jgi:hypothetical protein